jgi:hypothetical protein
LASAAFRISVCGKQKAPARIAANRGFH